MLPRNLTARTEKPSVPWLVMRLMKAMAAPTALVLVSWYGMLWCHELGHALAAVLIGASPVSISVPLLGFSHTDIGVWPRPVVVVWSGPIFGSLVPLVFALILAALQKPLLRVGGPAMQKRCLQIAWFFAGFNLIANGAYIGLGWIDRIGDTGELLDAGHTPAPLIIFGCLTGTSGLACWHQLGPRLGLSSKAT